MERHPVLALILRFGGPGSGLLALAVALAVIATFHGALGMLSIVIGIVAGGIVWLLARSYVELVTIVAEMLVPR